MKIAIVMAVFNPHETFFLKQIRSIKQQTFTNWHCFMSDDDSSDEKKKFIRDVIEKDEDFRVKFSLDFGKKNLGSMRRFEEALKLVTPDFDVVALCDQDDLWDSQKLEILAPVFDNPKISLVHSNFSSIDNQDRLLEVDGWKSQKRKVRGLNAQSLLFKNTVTGCTVLFRKELLKLALPFPTQSKPLHYHHDQWLALLALEQGEVYSFDKPLVLYRQHQDNVVGLAKFNFLSWLKKSILSPHHFHKKNLLSLQSRQVLARDYIGRLQKHAKDVQEIYKKQLFFLNQKIEFRAWFKLVNAFLANDLFSWAQWFRLLYAKLIMVFLTEEKFERY
jgi:glycosyltransferase involved in cell wall biosynthesis